MFHNVYEGKRVLVTSHTGFKGSWLALWLKELGAEVIGLSLPPAASPSFFEAARLAAAVTHYEDDIRDYSRLVTIIKDEKPEIVFHMAAQSLVRSSYRYPRETYEVNVMGTVNILEAVREVSGVRSCIIVTSDKCYENKEGKSACKEEDPMGGPDPYSSSKGSAELAVAAYDNSFFKGPPRTVGLASVRAGNVIGGGDWAEDRILPDCIHALSSGKPITVRNPDFVRPWQYVLEPLSGYLWLAALLWGHPDRFSGGWNFGPDSEGHAPVRRIVERVIQEWGSGRWVEPIPAEDDQGPVWHESSDLRLDCSKARQLLSWRPVYSLGEGLRETVTWYKKFYENPRQDVADLSRRKLTAYLEKARSQRASFLKDDIEK